MGEIIRSYPARLGVVEVIKHTEIDGSHYYMVKHSNKKCYLSTSFHDHLQPAIKAAQFIAAKF